MRIISGLHKGRLIAPPRSLRARPTTDFAREGLFNILINRYDFDNLAVLDLFSGTGSISYEFASRGASPVHSVDKDNYHISFIRKMIEDLRFTGMKAVHIDARTFLKTCNQKYDIVFADPPYDLSWFESVPELVLNSGVINSDGLFIIEHPKHMSFSKLNGFFEHRNYGGVNFSFFHPVSEPV